MFAIERTQWQFVSGFQRPTLETTHFARQMRRTTAENDRDVESAGYRDVGARSAPPCTKGQRPSWRDGKRRVAGNVIELRADDGDDAVVGELELRPRQRHLERRGVGAIPDDRVRKSMRERIHRT